MRVVETFYGIRYEYSVFNDEYGYACWMPLPVDSLRDVPLNATAAHDVIRAVQELYSRGYCDDGMAGC